MPRLRSLLITLASALVYGLCFPPLRMAWLAWVAQVPFLIAVRRSRPGTAVFLGWVFAVVVAYVTGDWFPRAVSNYYDQPPILGVAMFFGVSSIMAAPYVMAFTLLYQRLARGFGVGLPLLTAAAWVAGELGRSKLLTGCPWAVFGYSQAGVSYLPQIADWGGVYAVSFVLVAVNAALAETWLRRSQSQRVALGGVALAAGLAVVAFSYGIVRSGSREVAPAAASTAVAIVQANLDLGSQWRAEFYGRNLEAYLRLTQAAIAERRPAIVFWPESAMTFFIDREPLYRQSIGSLLQPANVELMSGGPHARNPPGNEAEEQYFNSMYLLAPSGEIVGRYDKRHLLPFAEYFPLPEFDFLQRSFGRVREFTPGAVTPPLPTVAGRAGIVVCNEAMFPEPAASRVAEGAEYLVNPAHDGWLGDEKFSAQVFDMAWFRAIEQDRYVVRTSTSGPSAIIQPDGVVQVKTADATRAWIHGSIEPRRGRTIYSHVGDLFASLCVVVCLLAALALGQARRLA